MSNRGAKNTKLKWKGEKDNINISKGVAANMVSLVWQVASRGTKLPWGKTNISLAPFE